jgi:formate-dependent nitrite reductase cytochrome c552 subunit
MTGLKIILLRWPRRSWLVFLGILFFFTILGAAYGIQTPPASAAADPGLAAQEGGYVGPERCAACHEEIHTQWLPTRHARAFSSPIFQQNWEEIGSDFECLACHTTGYDPAVNEYAFEGVTCEACHGPLTPGHPAQPMPIEADHELCARCHKTTTDEWGASQHSEAGIQCQACHNPHAQTPRFDTVTELCTNCHGETGSDFTHGTHADAGLECSNCHMYTSPRASAPVEGLVPTGHTFAVGSEACIACHQDTVHTRDKILQLSGEALDAEQLSADELRALVQEQEETITDLQGSATVRLYTGLAQGAIVGLVTGSVAAWVVSRSVSVVEVSEEEEDDEREENEG